MKFLATIRFDGTDPRVFEQAADEGEWAVSGAFAFVSAEPGSLTGKARQACANGLLGLGSFGRSTFATVTGITETAQAEAADALADHFVAYYGAPDRAAALPAAEAELAFIADLCAELNIGQVVAVARDWGEDGRLREAFRVIDKPKSCAEGGAWQIVEEAP